LEQQHVLAKLLGDRGREESLEDFGFYLDKFTLIAGDLGPLSHELLGAEVGGSSQDLLAHVGWIVVDGGFDKLA
jgi:hypothetical protein